MIGVTCCGWATAALFDPERQEKRMKSNNLTLVAALPMGGGCMSSLPAEKNEQPVKVQMKAAYFEEPKEEPLPKIEPPPTIQELAQKYLDAHEGLME